MTTDTPQIELVAPWRIGVDVGGTFTDLVLVDIEGSIHVVKTPSTPLEPSKGVLAAVARAAEDAGLSIQDLLAKCSHFVHASTVATNIILERRGDPVGMLVTRGFRDSIEIRRGIRENAWNHRLPFPPVLSPRYLRMAVSGRLDRHGQEIEPLGAEDIRDALETFKAEGVNSIAICLYNSFLNDEHEVAAARLIAEEYPEAWVTVSSHVSHMIGEYERSSTAVLNAYIAPHIVTYMRHLSETLADQGLRCPLLVVQNNGGSLTVDKVEQRPVSLLLSGPASGVGALALYSEFLGTSKLLSMEIGGTSCDVMLLSEDGAEMASEFDLGGYHVALPSIDIHSVGAGGGTIAGVDKGGMLFAGPQGAGADPGPAAYDRGGEEPTVTDAQLVLGRLKPGLLAGDRRLDMERAACAIENRLAKPLGLSVEAAAAGVLKLVDQQLFHAVQKISAERGRDPRRYVLVAAGGAGPMHASSIGRKLDMEGVYIPRLAGAFCALGMLNAPIRHEVAVSCFDRVGPEAGGKLQPVLTKLEAEARDQLRADGFDEAQMEISKELDLRHPGQVGTLRIPVAADDGLDWERVRQDFLSAHSRVYGHSDPEGVIEIVGVRVVGAGVWPALALKAPDEGDGEVTPIAERPVVFEQSGEPARTRVYDGSALRPGASIDGPAIVEEATTCIVIEPGDKCSVDALGNYVIAFARNEARS